MTTSANSRVVAPIPHGDEVGGADAVGTRFEHGAGQRLRRPALAEPLAEHERRGEQHRRRVGDALAGDVLGRPVSRSEHARPARLRAGWRLRRAEHVRGRRSRPAPPHTARGVTTTSNRSGSNARSCTAAFTESSSDLHAVVPRRLTRERGVPRSVAADGGDACAAGARDVERAGERPLERRVEERAEERDGAVPAERDAVHARPEVELGLDPGEGGIEAAATRTACAPSVALRVAVGSACPDCVAHSLPNGGCVSRTRNPWRRETLASARLACAMTSAAIPCPERHAIVYVVRRVM